MFFSKKEIINTGYLNFGEIKYIKKNLTQAHIALIEFDLVFYLNSS
jgi:hypothetical protein